MTINAEDSRSSGIQVLARAIDILRALAARPGGLTQADIGEELGLARTTVHRIVGALVEQGLVTVQPGRGRYQLGPELRRLAEAAHRDMLHRIHPLLEELSAQLRETVDLSVLDGRRVVFLDQVVASRRLQAVSAVGESFPLHTNAPGKVLLAALHPADLNAALPTNLDPATSHTITSMKEFRRELMRVKRDGVAYDREEQSDGICAAAVAVDGPSGAMAVSVPMPAQRFVGREEELRTALLAFRERWDEAGLGG